MCSSLQLVGKRAGWRPPPPQLISLRAGSSLLYLGDELSGKDFLVDTGASRSVLPHSSPSPPCGPRLAAANGRIIPSWGSRQIPLRFGGFRYSWEFLLAGVDRPILGLDFLADNSLMVDTGGRRIVVAGTGEVIGTLSAAPADSSVLARLETVPPDVREVLQAFPDIMSDDLSATPPKHDVRHSVETTGRPLFAKARRLDQAKLAAARAEFAKMERAGIVCRSHSPWVSPLHMVPKPDGSWRPCGDYRRLNNATLHDHYPLPNIQDFVNNLDGCSNFSKLDLIKGYFQVPMAAGDVPKTAIITPFGLFEFLKMPFGLRNAAQTFQRMMDRIFAGLPFCFIYLDDILIANINISTISARCLSSFTFTVWSLTRPSACLLRLLWSSSAISSLSGGPFLCVDMFPLFSTFPALRMFLSSSASWA